MKTAMQELIETLKSKKGGMEIYLNANTETIERFLEKEKEQIRNAHTQGHNDCYEYHFLKNSANEIAIKEGEEYYNQTYNQNK